MELCVDNLSCARGGVPVLEGVSFRVPAGGVLILRGPNGIGKTTLLRTLAGLQPAMAGDIAPGPDNIAYSGHSDGVKSALTVAENLRFWAQIYGVRDIELALAGFALRSLSERLAQNLSAGQKRRLGLARLLVTGRKIWVLDEPTVSLDQDSVTRFAAVVADHAARGGIAVIATHVELGLAAETLDLSPFRANSGTQSSTRGAFDEAFL